MRAELDKTGYSQLNTVSLAAGQAAYERGGDWLRQAWAYIGKNLDFVRDFLSKYLPKITLIEPQGTYLAWLDFRDSGVPPHELDAFITQKAGLWTDDGQVFGPEGLGFQRINLACPKKILEPAMAQLKAAF
jgi:cystathionine beta-lyase